ncbi:MAG: HAD hydrolase-like protein [Clostridia bacterium]|nr:HAD hydrolase-like protein [Clostridia bacterium]
MKYTHIFFDLDGTVTDPYEGITKAVSHALGKFGIEIPDRKALSSFIGPPLYDSFRKFYGLSEEDAVLAVSYYREYYVPIGIYECEIFNGINELLKALHESDAKIYVATSKPESMAVTVLSHFGLDKYFDGIYGATLDKSRVKKSDVIAYALDKIGNPDPKSCIMIGDTAYDVEGARENSIDTLGVTFNGSSPEPLISAGAIGIFSKAAELQSFLFS